jgi:hypothetical protein
MSRKTGTSIPRLASRSTSSTSPGPKAASPSSSTKRASPRRHCCPRNRIGWRTGACYRIWQASNNSNRCSPEHCKLAVLAQREASSILGSVAYSGDVNNCRSEATLDFSNRADFIHIDVIYFARTEGRFAKQFDKEGKPSATLLSAQQDRLENWRLLQDLAGIK